MDKEEIGNAKLNRRGFLWLMAGSAVTAAAAAFGCGGSGGGSGGGEIPVRSISEDDRHDLLDELQAFLNSNDHLSLGEQATAALAWVRTRPEFVDSDINEDGVWAIFVDAAPLMLFFNREPDPDPNERSVLPAGRAPTEVPDNTTAMLINTLGPYYLDLTPVYQTLLAGHGYSTIIDPGTVESLRVFNDDGIFIFVGAHSGKTNIPILSPGGNFTTSGPSGRIRVRSEFGVLTSTRADRATSGPYLDDMAHGRLGFGMSITGNGQPGNRDRMRFYFFTAAFVDTYMNFGQDSLVWFNSCRSHTPLSTTFVQACVNAGAGLYVGWDRQTNYRLSRDCGCFVLDRLLGSNTTNPREIPPQRPFDYVRVWQDMARQGLPPGLLYTVGSGNFGLLAPSIAYVLINEFDEEAHLFGTFGNPASNEREVRIAATPVTVKSWTPDKIIVELPQNLAGDVEVRVRGHRSNIRQITQWRVEVNYEWKHTELTPLSTDGVFYLEFRADVGHYRDAPGVPPLEPIRWAVAKKDSQGALVASGSATANCENSWSGIATYLPGGFLPPPSYMIVARMKIDTSNGTGALGLALGDLGPAPFTWTTTCPGDPPIHAPFTVTFGLLGGSEEFFTPDPARGSIPLPALPLTFGNDYKIPSVHYIDDSFTPIKIEIRWPEVIPTAPPDPGAARSVPDRGGG